MGGEEEDGNGPHSNMNVRGEPPLGRDDGSTLNSHGQRSSLPFLSTSTKRLVVSTKGAK